MDLLRIATAGSVDDGKSTLIGRLLYDSKAIADDQLAAMARASRQRGDSQIDLALLTDGLRAEREQGITIDVAYRYFATAKRKFIIADTPGHIQYTRNMVTGASTAELAVILIDAQKGVVTQSRRHGFLASLLQIPHILVAVNKMDIIGFNEERYQAIVDEFTGFAERLEFHSLTFIPISALQGDNVVHKSINMPWYEGPSLIHYLETVNTGVHHNLVDFRFPVQIALRPHHGFRGFAGRVASGAIGPGAEVAVLPSGRISRVTGVFAGGEAVSEASQGDSVALTLADEIDVSRGDMIVSRENQPAVTSRLECILCWLNEEPARLGQSYLLLHTTRQVRAAITTLEHRIDVDTLRHEHADTLHLNEIGRAHIETTQPIYCDAYRDNRATGSFILVDPHTHNTVAAGLIQRTPSATSPRNGRRQSSNVVWDEVEITRALREERNGHQAAALWFTGLSGAGKSTVARLVERRLFALSCQTIYLDGDNLRHGLNGDLGFSTADRKENIRRTAEVARVAFEHGNLALCTLISPFRADREAARKLFPEGRFLEIYVKCDVAICRERDPKGLYARADAGEIAEFTGVSSPYEAPLSPEIVVETNSHSAEECAVQILAELARRGILKAI
jgi:bifunctional enzyme CysN/CysC